MALRRVSCLCLGLMALGSLLSGQVAQLTDGPGSDTEAAWSPDGRRVAFQRERDRDVDLRVLDLATRSEKPLVTGPGHACFPAWSPDGKWIAYTFAHFTSTIARGIEHGYNLFVVPASGGEPRRLTGGLVRDYTPTFSPDGRYVYFSSTRGASNGSLGIFRVAFEGGEPEPAIVRDARDTAFGQPDLSSDGRFIACGYIAGFRSNWTLRLLRLSDPVAEFPLTDPDFPLYGPRWSPDGKWLACTGYRPGDAGWGIYLVEVGSGRCARLDAGPSNSRSPTWSPDGTELAFENDRSGTYKLYRLEVPAVTVVGRAQGEPPRPVVRLSFADDPGETVRDLSGLANHGTVAGEVIWENGGATFGQGQYVTIPQPKGCDFGDRDFTVKAIVSVEKHTDDLRLIVVGDYPTSRLGWQIFLDKENRAFFNSRAPDNRFIGARSDEPLPIGRKVTLVGIRRRSGKVELYLDGLPQHESRGGATMAYPAPGQIRIGTQFDGKAPFVGTVYEFEVCAGALSRTEMRQTSLKEFLTP